MMNKSFLLLALLGSSLLTSCAVTDDELTDTTEQQLDDPDAGDVQPVDDAQPVPPPVGTMQVGQTCRPGNVAPQPLVCAPKLVCNPDPIGGYGRCALPPPPPPARDEPVGFVPGEL